jgi:hypothetical protein
VTLYQYHVCNAIGHEVLNCHLLEYSFKCQYDIGAGWGKMWGYVVFSLNMPACYQWKLLF